MPTGRPDRPLDFRAAPRGRPAADGSEVYGALAARLIARSAPAPEDAAGRPPRSLSAAGLRDGPAPAVAADARSNADQSANWVASRPAPGSGEPRRVFRERQGAQNFLAGPPGRPAATQRYYAGLETAWTDNATLASRSRLGDAVARLSAGLDWARLGPRSWLDLGLHGRFTGYARHEELSNAQALLLLRGGREWRRGYAYFDNQTSLLADPGELDLSGPFSLFREALRLGGGWRSSRWQLDLDGAWRYVEYLGDEGRFLDRQEYEVGAGVGWRLSASQQLFVQTRWRRQTFREPVLSDFDGLSVLAGTRGELRPRFAWEAALGVEQVFNVTPNRSLAAYPETPEDQTALTGLLRLTWKLNRDQTRMELAARRRAQLSTVSSLQQYTDVEVRLLHSLNRLVKISVEGGVELGERSAGPDQLRWNAAATIEVELRRHCYLYGSYNWMSRDSGLAGDEGDYRANTVSLGAVLRW